MARRVRLTDQALVAVTLARRHAETRAARADLADLLVGLTTEPEGAAGHRLRAEPGAAIRLTLPRARTPRLPALEIAVEWAAREVVGRPTGTLDLLDAAVVTGGGDIAELLEVVGYEPSVVAAQQPWDRELVDEARGRVLAHLAGDWAGHAETFGLAAAGADDLAPDAALAVARARALGGGAVDLLLGVAVSGIALDLHELIARLRAHLQAGRAQDRSWDAGLDGVVEAARRWARGQRVEVDDLLAAAAVTGGSGPRMLLDEMAT